MHFKDGLQKEVGFLLLFFLPFPDILSRPHVPSMHWGPNHSLNVSQIQYIYSIADNRRHIALAFDKVIICNKTKVNFLAFFYASKFPTFCEQYSFFAILTCC